MSGYYLKTNRIYTSLRRYAWLFIVLVALGGLWYPKIGLLMLPVMLALGVLGFLRGKYWCGNICPHGSFFDGIIMPWSRNAKIPIFLRSWPVLALAFGWFMFILVSRLAAVLSFWGSITFWDKLGYIFVMNYLVVTIVGTILALSVNPRTWCSFCPMGTFQLLLYKVGHFLGLNRKTDLKVFLTDEKACKECGRCARSCPMQLVPYKEFDERNILDSTMCIRCGVCAFHCPTKILYLGRKDCASSEKNKAGAAG